MPRMRGPTPPTYPPTPPPLQRKRKASDAVPKSENDHQSQTLPPSPKRTQRELSFISISSGGHEDAQHDQLESPDDRPVINTEPELSDEQKHLLDTIVSGRHNVFFTGSAGCGNQPFSKSPSVD
ncbi:hypothetical protein FOCG_15863 [Fusarium oxysporum f. sp. radicis-lycopersici 26381]|nr:hypothetical protein FOWG_14589 [Fusarium oxysporum f. sp. lycopersici MN25]EXL41701.1 hypothetical protein FOCG_15863 [Fusarium oxysporum f. sp. radicis-lycopersici 26381]KAJ4273744.1 hypothetical protein NW764_012291 [Fusarium oxysporum]